MTQQKGLRDRLAALTPEQRQRLSEMIRASGGGETDGAIEKSPRDAPKVLSFTQERLWFQFQFDRSATAYNVPVVLRLRGDLDVEALKHAFREFIKRHQILRTSFPRVGDYTEARVDPASVLDWSFEDLSASEHDGGAEQAERRVAEEIGTPFDLSTGPVIRFRLLRLEEQDHILAITMHHIVSDGWSVGVLTREISALYGAFSRGDPSPLPDLPIQYSDYARWQRDWMQGDVLDRQLGYWKGHLRGMVPLELPADRPRPPVQTFEGASHTFAMPTDLLTEVRALGRREDATLAILLQAVFTVLLYRYTDETDIVLGSPVANRNREEIEGLVGFFANNLVMRTDLSGDPSAREVIQRVRNVALDAYDHQDLPFERLVNELQPARDPSRNPLFQIGFAVQNSPVHEQSWDGLKVESVEVDHQSTRFDLECHVFEDSDRVRLVMVYNVDLFDRSTIQRFGGHYLTLLESVVADPSRPISALPLMGRGELEELAPSGPRDYPDYRPPIQLFEEQVERTPDARAVVAPDMQMSFGEINRKANRLAHELRGLGVGPEVVVALCAERGPEMVTGVLAILKAGGAFLPIDPDYPVARIEHILTDSRAPLMLLSEGMSGNLPEAPDCTRVSLEDARTGPETNPEPIATPSNAAYVIYTSGSTGSPKGVVVENRSLAHLLASHGKVFGLGVEDRATQVANIAFDASVFEMWPALTSGAELHFPDGETLLDPRRLVDWAHHEAITFMWLPTALGELVMQEPWPEPCALTTLTVAGDRLREVPDAPLPYRVFNLYGPTENTVWSTECEVAPGSVSPPIGRPIEHTYVRVLDTHLNRVPLGVPGELFLGGAGLARGYLNRPDLDEKLFIDDPFSDRPEARLYATGDRVRYLSDGQLEFLGRNDEQVKIRGHRVELGEVESILKADPSVDDAVAVVREDEDGEAWLVAYLVPARVSADPEAAGDLDDEQLVSGWRSRLSRQVPSYMVPAAFVVLEGIPLNPHGKLDRGALPAPSGTRSSEVPYVEPRTESERLVASIWQDVLHKDRVGRNDHFFELGGHSLLATQVMSRVRDASGFEVPLRVIFEDPMLAALAERIDEAKAAQDHGGPALKKAPRTRKVTRPR